METVETLGGETGQVLKISGLTKRYGSFNVLNGLNMNINKGDVYGFLGKNGCGKTTTMNIICNIITKDEGDVELSSKKIGYLPETPMLFDYMNGYEYLEYIAACSNYSWDVKKRTLEVLEIVGMLEGAKRRIKGYSRGMNQRLGIAAAIFNSPELLILDEPTSALDPQGRAEVMNIIPRLSQTGATVILCTHILSDVERVANRVGIVANGRMAEEGTIADIQAKYSGDCAQLNVQLFDMSDLNRSIVMNAPFVKAARLNDKNDTIILTVDDMQIGATCLIHLLHENKLTPKKLEAAHLSLEDIYMKVVNGNAD